MVTDITNISISECPVTATLDLIGGRWKTLIIFHLNKNTRRFGEIAARMPNISRKVLTEQLKEMEKDGLITRKQYKEIPPRVEYSLTDLGKSLTPVIDGIAAWGHQHLMTQKKGKKKT